MRTIRLFVFLAIGIAGVSHAGPPTILVVNSTADDPAGPGVECVSPGMSDICTLRAALQQASGTPSITDIHFNIDAMDMANDCTGDICTITVLFSSNSGLPGVPAGVTIDGSTQPGNAGVCTNPPASRPEYRIVLRGESGNAAGLRFETTSIGSTVRGINFSNHADAIVFSGSSNSAVECSFIGTTPDGLSAAPNLLTGISIDCEAQNNRIGGAAPELGNLISTNIDRQVLFNAGPTCGQPTPPGPDNTLIQNNFIGPDKTGIALPAGETGGRVNGIEFLDGDPGTSVGNIIRDNIIAGNASGIRLDPTATDTHILANFIGTDPSGTSTLGHAFGGIDIFNSSDNTIGGPGEGNVIANSEFEAVFIINDDMSAPLPVNNTVSQNTMRDNGFGIELAPPFDLNPNDPGDSDTGSNNLQNSPELATAVVMGGTLTIEFIVQSPGNLNVEFFVADASGADGEAFVGSTAYSGSGMNDTASFPGAMAQGGDMLVATATDTLGNTSEFSLNVEVVEQFVVDTDIDEADGECMVDCSLRDAVALAGDGAQILFSPTLSGSTITLALGEIVSTKSLTIDAISLMLPVTLSGGGSSRLWSATTGDLTLRGLVLTDGDAGPMGQGGAILFSSDDSTLTIEESVITGNFAEIAGGGIYMESGATTSLVVRRSTVFGNTSFYRGGAIYIGGTANALIENSTLSTNSGFIGEITSESNGASVEFRYSTVVATSSSMSLFFLTNGAEVVLDRSIVATPGQSQACDLTGGGTVVNSGSSIVQDGSCSAQDIAGAPLLGELTQLGPLAFGHVPLPGSPAVDTADDMLCPPVDQLGLSRPIDGDLDGAANCDLGAIEFDRLFADGLETP